MSFIFEYKVNQGSVSVAHSSDTSTGERGKLQRRGTKLLKKF